MNIALCNLTGGLIKHNSNCNSGEIINICKIINSFDNCKCKILNHYTPGNKEDEKDLIDLSVEYSNCSPNEFDIILIMNSHANFYGGIENTKIMTTYKFLSDFNGKIYYLYNDANLPFKQIWPSIEHRQWNKYCKNEVIVKQPISILSQFFDVNSTMKENVSPDTTIREVIKLDFGTWILQGDYKNKIVKNLGEYDLIYGGSFRSGRRMSKFYDYFTNRNIRTAIYGSMNEGNFKDPDLKLPEFLGRVKHDSVIDMNSKGLCTVVCGESKFNDNIHTIRIYESILAGCITFIDEEFDKGHLIYPNCNYLYVNSGKELEDKICKLKAENMYNELLNQEYEFLDRKANYPLAQKLQKILMREEEI